MKLFSITVITIVFCFSKPSETRIARNEQSFANAPKSEITNKTATASPPTSSPFTPLPSTVASTTTSSPVVTSTAVSNFTTIDPSSELPINTLNSVQLFSAPGQTFASNIASVIQENLSKLTNRLAQRINWLNATENVNSLWNNIRRSDLVQSPITLSVAGITFAGFMSMIALYLFPSLRSTSFPFNYRNQLKQIGELGRSVEEIADTVNKAIDSYAKSEPDTCMMMALCTLGNAKQVSRRSRTIDTINTVLNFPGLDEFILSNKNWRESHAFGRNGGDCEMINMQQKCPFNYDTWKLLLSSLSSVI